MPDDEQPRAHPAASPETSGGSERRAFAVLRVPGFRPYLATFFLTMMADNIEHVISYWLMFQKFHSAALGGFAVVSHWLPFLAFSVAVGALNDRFDSRRLIQLGGALFLFVSAAWGYLFLTDTLEMWHAMVLLVLHGCAGVFWMTSSQMLLYDIVGPGELKSAVRLNATARYLGVLVGPGIGSLLMLSLGPTGGILLNTAFYLPLLLWLLRAPYGRHLRSERASQQEPPQRAVRGLGDILQTIRDIRGLPALSSMVLLVGAASFFVGNSYQAQMPGFAHDLGHGDPGLAYTSLLGADAAGALLAGLLLESRGSPFAMTSTVALRLASAWAAALLGFALCPWYAPALVLLFLAGFFELSFSSLAQTLVQMHAPEEKRGRVLGLFGMSSSGLRTFSGLSVGLAGSVANIHLSLAVSALLFISVAIFLGRRAAAQPQPGDLHTR
ncbi:MAG TPA: MFS transporter [Polyangiaceae bacterium]|nr:MFS transporter [Polyangiaceae bacterium]